jgi:hypothetical protein
MGIGKALISHQFVRWEIQGIVSSLFEVAIFVSPLWLVRDLQKPLTMKVQIFTPFALRLV